MNKHIYKHIDIRQQYATHIRKLSVEYVPPISQNKFADIPKESVWTNYVSALAT